MQRAVDLLLQILAEESTLENADAALFHAAQGHAQQVKRENLSAPGAVGLFADALDHRQADFG